MYQVEYKLADTLVELINMTEMNKNMTTMHTVAVYLTCSEAFKQIVAKFYTNVNHVVVQTNIAHVVKCIQAKLYLIFKIYCSIFVVQLSYFQNFTSNTKRISDEAIFTSK